jgi:cation diffusion facilitator CzcD-associated flavoprotein CzcO
MTVRTARRSATESDSTSEVTAPPTAGKFCILGAGSSGLAVAKNFRECGIAFDCLEREDDVGGNWYFGKPHSSVYRSTRLISSKRGTEYTDFPMPDDWPEHPGHDLVWEYLRSYARRFDLYRSIEFNTAVVWVEPGRGEERGARSEKRFDVDLDPSSSMLAPTSGWDVTLADGSRRRYRGVVIANGHNWDPRWPGYPGRFAGEAIHSAQYKSPEICRGRRVLVVGGGNSGFDIATDVAPYAAETIHSLRRGYRILPRFYQGTPIDRCGRWLLALRAPLWLRRWAAAWMQRSAWDSAALDSLPSPDHRFLETHPVINSRWPYDVARGAIGVKPDVRELDGDRIEFVDGSLEAVDLIIYATGFNLSFPFIDRDQLHWRDDRPDLYLNVFHPDRDDLFVVGLIQPDSGQFGLVDYQSQLIAAYVRGLDRHESAARRFQQEKRGSRPALDGGIRYVRSPRHLMEVEHHSYQRELRRRIKRFK